ncbi:MAG: hypothetical protein LBP39_03105 [Rickettsiales bacterium]|nr:hypothetical protein [Rickettsiales bacterium]
MKINKKLNYSRIVAGYLFLGALTIFISLGAGTCLASAVNVNNFSGLEKAIDDSSSSTINIEANFITLSRELPVISRSLTISSEAYRSTMNGNNKNKILTFNKDSGDISINNIHFLNGHNKNPSYFYSPFKYPFDGYIGGGAVHIEEGTNVAFNNTNFSNNIAISHGGAICSTGGSENKSSLRFNTKTTFAGNKSTTGEGGAIYAKLSDLTFNGEVKFEKNKSSKEGGAIFLYSHDGGNSTVTFEGVINFIDNISKNSGGAIYSEGSAQNKNILILNDGTTFANNESKEDNGGAMYVEHSNLFSAREVNFTKNKSHSDGGAIFSLGSAQNKNILTFNGKATFNDNESTGCEGGAIYAKYSYLIFAKRAYFIGNKNNGTNRGNGGAIFSRGTVLNKNVLTFNGIAMFTDNIITSGKGGAIYAWYSDLIFNEEAIFENNKSLAGGGAVIVTGNLGNVVNATFNRLATFEKNSSKEGGAIYLFGDIDMRFNSGLALLDNITEIKESGAIHLEGKNNSRGARVTIVQKDPRKPTEIKGNKSNNGQGHNAFYLQKQAELNFVLENGNIDLYDTIGGDRTRNDNTVTLEGSEGQFKLGVGGSIYNVNLINRGSTLNLGESQAAAKPLHFSNSGRIIFEIFPENNNCSGIQARDITLEEGTTLEIDAAQGTYKAGDSYDLLVSENTIKKAENINVTLPQKFAKGLRARGEFRDKLYHILIEADDENNL